MSLIKARPHYTLSAEALADWLDGYPEMWWTVDCDSELTGLVDFPCPTDELSPVIRRIGKELLLYDTSPTSAAHGEAIAKERLDELAENGSKYYNKIFTLTWVGSDEDFLLHDDDPLI